MSNKLAIVIPAYKLDFFDQALQSIADQTNKDFTLYIGDDGSPDDLYAVVERYVKDVSIVYRRFEENLGGSNLVNQWERCIDLINNEEWIWLFSDDDIMTPTCVQEFYNTLEKAPLHDLYRFDLQVIDNENKTVHQRTVHPPAILSSYRFFRKRVGAKMDSFVVEYIFRRSTFEEVGKFQNFDLGWSTDVATWIKISDKRGICKIEHASVKWRMSNKNISPNVSPEIIVRKMNAMTFFFRWAYAHFKIRGKNELLFCHIEMLKRLKGAKKYISQHQMRNIVEDYCNHFPLPKLTFTLMWWGIRIFS